MGADLEIIFRGTVGPPQPQPGELFVDACAVDANRCVYLASALIDGGLSILPRGTGTVRRLVLPADPTLDDMLACAFCRRLLSGRDPGPGAAAFAEYTGLVREGLQPGQVATEVSMEAVYLCLRNGAGDDLTEPAAAGRFLASWERMARVIMGAVDRGDDPFTAPLFAGGVEFARERAFLRNDQAVYRQDVARGRVWRVRLPDAPAEASGLYLDRPTSVLWKFWARRDANAPVGGSFLFLAVRPREGQWVFSTDPVQRVPIKSLAQRLNEAEAAEAPGAAPPAGDGWYDGAKFDHTLVAAPRGGTRLSDSAVLKTVATWARAKRVRERKPRWYDLIVQGAASGLVKAVVAVAVSSGLLVGAWETVKGRRSKAAEARSEAAGSLAPAPASVLEAAKERVRRSGAYLLVVGGGRAADTASVTGADVSPSTHAARICERMQSQYGFASQRTRLLVDDRQAAVALGLAVAGAPTRARVLACIAELAADAERSNGGECPRLFVYVSAPGAREGDTAYLALSGFDPAEAGATGLTVQELTGRLAGAFAWGHQLIVLDAAVGAGGNGADSAPVTAAGVREDWIRPVQVIATAGAADARLTPGLLSERVFKSLGEFGAVDGDRDGVVTDAELVAHLRAPAYDRRGRGQFLIFP